MKEIVDKLAYGLVELGVRDGDVVAVFMSNCPEMVFIIYALTKIGGVPALLNNALRGRCTLVLHPPGVSTGGSLSNPANICAHFC